MSVFYHHWRTSVYLLVLDFSIHVSLRLQTLHHLHICRLTFAQDSEMGNNHFPVTLRRRVFVMDVNMKNEIPSVTLMSEILTPYLLSVNVNLPSMEKLMIANENLMTLRGNAEIET